jgi:hypothetical protein
MESARLSVESLILLNGQEQTSAARTPERCHGMAIVPPERHCDRARSPNDNRQNQSRELSMNCRTPAIEGLKATVEDSRGCFIL